jgi:hypothetical protein
MPIGPTPQLKAGLFGRGGGMPAASPGKPAGPAPKPTGPKGLRIEHRIGIQAPAEVIWEVIRDLAAWSEWNPIYPRAAGEIRIGSTLDLVVALPGQPERSLQPVVLDWVPNEQLHWRLSMMGGFVRTIRYLEIEQLAEESCIVSNGEIFGGLMGPSVGRQVGRSVYRGFLAMNEALKDRAEGLHRKS